MSTFYSKVEGATKLKFAPFTRSLITCGVMRLNLFDGGSLLPPSPPPSLPPSLAPSLQVESLTMETGELQSRLVKETDEKASALVDVELLMKEKKDNILLIVSV